MLRRRPVGAIKKQANMCAAMASSLSAALSATPVVASAMEALLRSDPDSLDSLLSTVAFGDALAPTKSLFNCHFVALDGNGRPRVKDLARKLSMRVVDYVIPRPELEAALQKYRVSNSTQGFSELEAKARGLFTLLETSGEGGELLVYLLAETYLRCPQLLCKMSLKTNPQMHIHGADGIHATVDSSTGNLALYWCESKFRTSIGQAVHEALESIAPFLAGNGGSAAPHERDLQLLRDNLQLNDAKLEAALLRYLDPDDPLFNKLEFRGVCLAGFDSHLYPTKPNLMTMEKVRSEFAAVIAEWKTLTSKGVVERALQSFKLEIFCLPFPAIDKFRTAFREELHFNGTPRPTK